MVSGIFTERGDYMDNEQLLELKQKGIECYCEYIEPLREYHIVFSKDNRHYKKIIPIDDTLINTFSKSIISMVILEAEVKATHHGLNADFKK